ncbi:MAG TPA: hypothetical protein VN768_07125 [Acidimicrobiales bacterium]|nr:hypothetical protein [Acidimicrobiales bacterium]
MAAVAVMAGISLGAAACSSSPAAATYNPTTAKTDIAANYDTLFHFSTGTLASKEAVIQDGTGLKTAMHQALTSSESSAAQGAKVDSVSFLSTSQCTGKKLPTPCAKVKYDILGSGGTAILAGNTGYTVLVNGKWVVAKTTICTLLGLFYTASGKSGTPPGC